MQPSLVCWKNVMEYEYKMVDFKNEVLINQIDDLSARMLRKLARVNDVNTVVYSLDHQRQSSSTLSYKPQQPTIPLFALTKG